MTRPEQHTSDWDERFRSGDVPWEDEGVPPAVSDLFHTFATPPATVLEIGCGLGTTAVWLAHNGYDVAACDVSPKAVSQAQALAAREGVSVTFFVADALEDRDRLPKADVVFDRGVLHTFTNQAGLKAFADVVAGTQTAGGLWLNVSGSADTPDDPPQAGELGYPRLTLKQIAEVVEPMYEIVSVRQVEYGTTPGATDFRAFASVFQRRG